MKKFVVLLVVIVVAIQLAACGQHRNFVPGNKSTRAISDEVEIYLSEENETGTSVAYVIHNPTEINYATSSAYFIEEWVDGNWIVTDLGSHDAHIGDALPAGLSVTCEFILYETLPQGTYRLIEDIFQPENEKDGFLIAVEFTIE